MKTKIVRTILIIVALLGITGYAGYMTYQNRKNASLLNQLKSQNTSPSESEAATLVAALKKLMEVPNENPTIGTVSDVEKLRNQPFFSQAQNGDKVIVYAKAQKAILFRPSSGKIIDMVPISEPASPSGKVAGVATTATPVSTATPTPTPKPISILLLNGTEVSGLTNKYESQIKTLLPTVKTDKDKAAKEDYEKSVIVVVNSTAKDTAAKISTELGIATGDSPYGEDLTGKSDIVIIFGADKK